MSRPENSKTPVAAQLPPLRPLAFGSHEFEGEALFSIETDAGFMDGLAMTASLTEGLHQLTHRLALAANMGEIARVNELAALAFLADAANTLARSAKLALDKWEAQP